MKKQKTLSEKLKGYSLIASSILASAAADGQVIYTDIIPDFHGSDWGRDTIHIDLNNDGIVDFIIHSVAYYHDRGDHSLDVFIDAASGNFVAYTHRNVGALNEGDTIDNGLHWQPGNNLILATYHRYIDATHTFNTSSGNWLEKNGFLALRFTVNGEKHYGWARLSVSGYRTSYTIYDFAYGAAAHKPIKAGDIGCVLFYPDSDNDSYGDMNSPGDTLCYLPASGYSTDHSDCNDSDSNVHPGVSEICNSIDDNCNGIIDEGLTFTMYYQDADSDGYGNKLVSDSSCNGAPLGFVADSTDCNDTNPNVHPGAKEIVGNGIDDNCNGYIDEFGTGIPSTDADVPSFSIYPNPVEGLATIQFTLAQPSHVSIKVFDLSGKEIKTLMDEDVDRGTHTLQLNTQHFVKGVYLVTMITKAGIENKKLMVQ